jgi:siroheme synthase-like protein
MGEEKATRLHEFGARVEVISSEATDGLRELADGGRLTWTRRGYRPGDLSGAFIAIVADTSDTEVNRAVSEEARQRNVPLNVVDVTHLCTWIAPAIVRRGDVIVAASTGGASPALARKMREELAGTGHLDSRHGVMDFAQLAPLLAEARAELARRGVRLNPDHWQVCLTDELVDLVRSGDDGKAMEALMSCLMTGADCGCEGGTCREWVELAAAQAAPGDQAGNSAT